MKNEITYNVTGTHAQIDKVFSMILSSPSRRNLRIFPVCENTATIIVEVPMGIASAANRVLRSIRHDEEKAEEELRRALRRFSELRRQELAAVRAETREANSKALRVAKRCERLEDALQAAEERAEGLVCWVEEVAGEWDELRVENEKLEEDLLASQAQALRMSKRVDELQKIILRRAVLAEAGK